ncbi:MAG TPA: TetR family transcriptional regulator [Gemmatimonadales bacterium]|jgi:TetR/AcrR family transcriptional regulator|nr:TetR family transcriptional regulator [Gemmatimonadales bacterium]
MGETDGKRARDQILDAAEQLFAHKGLGPTTIKQIGAAARQNPALLYYYFGSKEKLYRAVLQRVLSGMLERGGAAFDAAPAPPAAIQALVAAQMDFVLSHPNAPRLLVREMIDHEARRAEAMLLELAAGLFERLCQVIEQGQREGYFRSDLEPRFAAISTIAQVVYFTIARPAIGLFFGEGTRGVPLATARRFGRHAGDFAVHALSNPEQRA